MRKKDVVFCIIMLTVSAVIFIIFGFNGRGDTVTIKKDGEIRAVYPLESDRIFDIGGNTVVIENGEVYISHADCPDKLCVKQGKIHDGSKKIICLPNRLTVEVSKKSDVDTVVR